MEATVLATLIEEVVVAAKEEELEDDLDLTEAVLHIVLVKDS